MQTAFKYHIAVIQVTALRCQFACRDVRSLKYGVAQAFQPGEGGLFNHGLENGLVTRALRRS